MFLLVNSTEKDYLQNYQTHAVAKEELLYISSCNYLNVHIHTVIHVYVDNIYHFTFLGIKEKLNCLKPHYSYTVLLWSVIYMSPKDKW